MKIQEHVPLAPFTTLGVGGTARFFIEAHSVDDVTGALALARARGLALFVLGGGSNIVVSDDGFNGIVLLMRIPGITAETSSSAEAASKGKHGGEIRVRVGSGVSWDEFVIWSIAHDLKGLECLSGVPGTVGGAVVANLGAYGAQCSDTFVHAEVFDTQEENGGLKVIPKEECNFSYHDSMFGHAPGRYILVHAVFALSKDPAVTPAYRDNRFDMGSLAEKLGRAPTQREVRDAVLAMREAKGSLIMKDRLSYKSAGSFFHMPFVSKEQYARVVARARELDAEKEEQLRPWAWEQPDGTYKLAPGFLLEYTEFQKGYVRGRAGVSPRHTLSIINVSGARAQEITELARAMQDAVEEKFGIRLEREVEYVGFA